MSTAVTATLSDEVTACYSAVNDLTNVKADEPHCRLIPEEFTEAEFCVEYSYKEVLLIFEITRVLYLPNTIHNDPGKQLHFLSSAKCTDLLH